MPHGCPLSRVPLSWFSWRLRWSAALLVLRPGKAETQDRAFRRISLQSADLAALLSPAMISAGRTPLADPESHSQSPMQRTPVRRSISDRFARRAVAERAAPTRPSIGPPAPATQPARPSGNGLATRTFRGRGYSAPSGELGLHRRPTTALTPGQPAQRANLIVTKDEQSCAYFCLPAL